MDTRPVLIGMNNPLRTEPHFALYPAPPRCTGHRIWQMLHERTGCSTRDYLRSFDRRNLLDELTWDERRAREASAGLWRELEGRRVAVLGASVRRVLWLVDSPPLRWQHTDGVDWFLLPHPSGLNRWYNDPVCREAAALRLEEMYERSR